MGRARKTALNYADDADRVFEGSRVTALRERAGGHERCEQLALGGLLNKPSFSELKAEVEELNGYTKGEPWPMTAQKLWTKRQVKELASQPGAVMQHWAKLNDLTFPWVMSDDGIGPHSWTATRSKCRHMDLNPTEQLVFFVELFTEFIAGPLINNGEQGHSELLRVLEQVSGEIDKANVHTDGDDEANEEIIESAMTRIRAVAAFASRKYGAMNSTKKDTMTPHEESDDGGSSLYSNLTNNEFLPHLGR